MRAIYLEAMFGLFWQGYRRAAMIEHLTAIRAGWTVALQNLERTR